MNPFWQYSFILALEIALMVAEFYGSITAVYTSITDIQLGCSNLFNTMSCHIDSKASWTKLRIQTEFCRISFLAIV